MERPTKEHILREIRRLAEEHDGAPVGKERFTALTGIRESVWRGRYWARYGDAVREAGLEPNSWQRQTLDDDGLLEALAIATRELGKFPTGDELKMMRLRDDAVPSVSVFGQRFGGRDAQIRCLVAWADQKPDFADVAAICAPLVTDEDSSAPNTTNTPTVVIGVVYLLRMGEFHKIGKSNDPGRRIYELGIQLPEKHDVVHVIETDDPSGIEAYWHRRFASQRSNGEWFRLSPADVEAFQRRRYM